MPGWLTPLRLDAYLVEAKLVDSIEKARSLVMAGHVVVNDQRQDKPGYQVRKKDIVRLKSISHFVSRGGEKLYSALKEMGLLESFTATVVLDCGASTGGFADCCLSLGAKKVVCVDIGTNQLDWKVKSDARVVSFEKTDIKSFSSNEVFDWILADLSFVKLVDYVSHLKNLSASNTQVIALIKPQFELDVSEVPSGGVVIDPSMQKKAIDLVSSKFVSSGYSIERVQRSLVLGQKGNQEFFIWCKMNSID